VQIAANSPFAHHLRRNPPQPLSTYEIEALPAFEAMRLEEKEALRQGQSELFMPLNAGEELVAVLAVGEKYTGEAYNHSDFSWLQEMAAYAGPLLWQARNLQSLQELNSYAFREVHQLAQERQQLEELLHLHERFTEMVSPSLREPFREIQSTVQHVEAAVAENGSHEALNSLNRQLAQLRLIVNNLILTADRVQKQRDFYLLDVSLPEVIEQALDNLSSMIEARRVTVDVDVDSHLPLVRGDQQRLTEAIQYLLHNAIKFNKIGGQVTVECGTDGHEIYLHIQDSGVGIRADRLPELWQGLTELPTPGEKGGGPRLGLVLTRFIVRAHGGRVEASSEYGSGSTFSVYLPVAGNE
jgi:signal transduction histidine kinase